MGSHYVSKCPRSLEATIHPSREQHSTELTFQVVCYYFWLFYR